MANIRRNNFNIANYIHLSYQGYLDDTVSTIKKVQIKGQIQQASAKIHNQFKAQTTMTVEEYLKYQEEYVDSMSAMVALFSANSGVNSKGELTPFSEIWNKYKENVRILINSMPFTQEEKDVFYKYVKSSAKAVNVANIMQLMHGKNALNIKELDKALLKITDDFDEDLLDEYKKIMKNNKNMEKKDWAHIITNLAAAEALKTTKNLEELNNIKKNFTLGQLIGEDYEHLAKMVNQLNDLYASGASAETINSQSVKIKRIMDTKIKGLGTETISFLNPVIIEKAKGVVTDLLHTGINSEIIKNTTTLEYTRKNTIPKNEIAKISAQRKVSLADVTIQIGKANKIKEVKISRKMRNVNAKDIIIAENLSIGQAIAMVRNVYNTDYLNNQYTFMLLNTLNFLFLKKNLFYKTKGKKSQIIVDNRKGIKRINNFTLEGVENALKSQVLSSFLILAYSTFFSSKFAALYDINNFIVPAPILFDYSMSRIVNEDLGTGLQSVISLGHSGAGEYTGLIKDSGSGDNGIEINGSMRYPIELMALKRHKTAVSYLSSKPSIKIKSYNITNKEYYYDIFNKMK